MSQSEGTLRRRVYEFADDEGNYTSRAIARAQDEFPGWTVEVTHVTSGTHAVVVELNITRDCVWTDPMECATARERSVAGISDDIPACPVHGAYDDSYDEDSDETGSAALAVLVSGSLVTLLLVVLPLLSSLVAAVSSASAL